MLIKVKDQAKYQYWVKHYLALGYKTYVARTYAYFKVK